ncbi:serine hydrolase domain-containing protein [Dyadobacter sp. LHD-138]|uniref:serine hydrolase domain-containing protein n=1 Tax=Dyadobacter sp. LHD-138 TaxID=3071413 RepID=UPI0027E18419|nr:serine hydrolase domain-containing protein [Dyadobacter sp. LHD-138]MDQ6477456.1 serine hydrolase domain-containing protein [Dyadobacter sp. LHD-138]
MTSFHKLPATILIVVFFFSVQPLLGQGRYDGPKTIKELQLAIEKILQETGTPAVGIALVNKDSTVWTAGLGIANLEKNTKATENTMFRIGSVSKMFVSLAILKLQQEDKVSLKDKVRDLVPEIEFKNPWEKTALIRVEHLLEHTTGWDDMRLGDYALDNPRLTLKGGLDFLPASRTSRWMPGTRMAYCNAGPPVAAYIIEKITGQTFEEYIQSNFFTPMGMENMTYFNSEAYKKLGAALYIDKEPQKYWNISVRPSGAINASPKDMARMLKFFISRGWAGKSQLISEESLKRMETASTTTGDKAGLEYGYGLANYSTPYKSYVYRSHGGGVNGGLTDFSYLPTHQLGYAIMINSGDGSALSRISGLIREFQTKRLSPDRVFWPKVKIQQRTDISGYYLPINPRVENAYFYERILGVRQIRDRNEFVFVNNLFGGWTETHRAINDKQYIAEETGKISLVKVTDPIAGNVVHDGNQVLMPVSPFMVYGQILLGGLWILYGAGAVLFGSIWLIRYWRGKNFSKKSIWLGLWPFMASLLVFLLSFIGGKDPFGLLGRVGVVSVSLMIVTTCFALTSIWSAINVVKERRLKINRNIYWHLAVLSCLHLIATFYLMWFGVIGIQTWK